MALDIPVEDAVRLVGHGGGAIVFPELNEPMCRRGFHQQELVELAIRFEVYPVPYQLFPCTRSECGRYTYTLHARDWRVSERRKAFHELIANTHGVLEGKGESCHHAVAYDHGRILDPDGQEFQFSLKNCEAQGFYGKQLWIFTS